MTRLGRRLAQLCNCTALNHTGLLQTAWRELDHPVVLMSYLCSPARYLDRGACGS